MDTIKKEEVVVCFGGNDETPSAGATLYRGPGDSTIKYPQSGDISAPKPIETRVTKNPTSPTFDSNTGLAIPGGS